MKNFQKLKKLPIFFDTLVRSKIKNTACNPAAELRTDKTYVTSLHGIGGDLNDHFHRTCEEVLAPALAQIASTDPDAGYHAGPKQWFSLSIQIDIQQVFKRSNNLLSVFSQN